MSQRWAKSVMGTRASDSITGSISATRSFTKSQSIKSSRTMTPRMAATQKASVPGRTWRK